MDPVSNYQKIISEGIGFVTIHDKEYPSRLRSISNMPYALYYLGELPKDNIPSVAIIGARNCSEYGRYVAGSFGESLALAGINVISGMALGIDGIGQRGALEAGGTTYAVLGSGVDVCYPRETLDLYRGIPQKGGVISCFPPGSEPQRRFFPDNNFPFPISIDRFLRNFGNSKNTISIRTKVKPIRIFFATFKQFLSEQ